MYRLTLALMIANQLAREEVKNCLAELHGRVILDESDNRDTASLISRLEQERPDIVIVDLSTFPPPWDDLVRNIRSCAATPLVIAMHTSADPETILGAIRSGANEYVYPPFEANLRKALERLLQEKEKLRSEAGTQGKTLGFVSAKGGCGATTIVCQVALALQRLTRQQILLADFDVTAGMVGFVMRTKARYSLLDALQNTHRLDLSYWKALVSNGVAGLEIISSPGAHEFSEPLSPESFRQVIRFARLHYDWVLIDLGRGVTLSTLSLMDEFDEAFLVSTTEVPALFQVKRASETFSTFGFSQERLKLILNRVPKDLDVTPAELEQMLGTPIYSVLPDEYAELQEAYGAGQHLAPASALGKHIQRLASCIAGVTEEKSKKKFLLFG